jgi:hypothetical protein
MQFARETFVQSPDNLHLAGLLFPLHIQTRRGCCISLDFLELLQASSGHDFLQVHIDLSTGRAWLVPPSRQPRRQIDGNL